MDPSIGAALISAASGILIFILGKIPYDSLKSRFFRRRHDIPNIMKTNWSCEWFYEDNAIYIKDTIKIIKWKRYNQFKALGQQVRDIDGKSQSFTYPIIGEVSPFRIIVLTYKAEKYPTQAFIGMACLQLSGDANMMNGFWCGLASKEQPDGSRIPALRTGKVKWKKTP